MTEQEPKAQARKVLGLPLVAVAVIAAVVLAAAGVGVYLALRPGATSASGPCMAVTGPDDTAKAEAVDCAAPDATFKLASTRSLDEVGCPEGAYREVRTGTELLCLMPNFVADTCYDPDDANSAFVVADCSSENAIRISEVIEGTTDPSGCPDGSGLGYPEPPVVFCIETPGA
ncbi:LppU/SCO3897 family protein [Actinokineospora fastidiosa]|uniref:Uncharacterized protein n=1 Tax=Actinokineospora fastidiosa TaxID=1816 RepID=A0A918L6Q2_9PSEU|nr:hypothetical protein [Actinokineospora fastidiosa]GGS15874.1 hypothetical protein GCM10010171_04990 [Actinokineospora fastidiosa]